DRSRGRSRSSVVGAGAGVGTSSCGCLEIRVLLGSRSIYPLSFDFMGEVGRKHVYFGQPESFHLCMLIVDMTLLPFFRVLLRSGPLTAVLHPWAFIARVELSSKTQAQIDPEVLFNDLFWLLSTPAYVSHSLRFIMSFNDASKPFSAPTWARSLGNLEKHVALASFRSISGYIARKTPASLDVEFSIFSGSFAGGGAAVFPALGQGSFRGTTPTELDEYSKANSSFDSPAYVTYQSREPGRKMLCAASEPFIFLLWSGVMSLDALVIDASGLSTDLDVCDDCPCLGILNPTFVERLALRLRPGAGGNQMLLKGDSRLGPGVGRDHRLCASFRSDESKSILVPRWMELRDFREDTRNVPPTYHIVT
ncbi:hypothetical protein HID58_087879, partial [Brassica napus]